MDGNIYKLTDPNPVPLWRHKDYIGGFDNEDYNLDEVVKVLETKDWIRNIEIVGIPHYNRYDGRTKAVEFDYKLPTKKCLSILKEEELFKNDTCLGL